MAAQVLSGSGNVTYTNSTGQNVRLVINYLETASLDGDTTVSFPGNSITIAPYSVYGKTLAYKNATGSTGGTSSMASDFQGNHRVEVFPIPLEIALANGDTFSITGASSAHIKGYNMIIIPEAG